MNPLLVKNFKATAAIGAFKLVKFGADDDHVSLADSATAGLIGAVNRIPAATAEDRVDVVVQGIATLVAGSGITRGDLLTSDSAGNAVTASEDNRVVGIALASASSGDQFPALLNPSGQVTDSATFVASGTIAAADVKTLNATPVTLVAAPGSGKALILLGATLFMDYASAGYDSVGTSDDLTLRYTNGSGGLLATVETTGFLDQTSDQTRYVYPVSTAAITPTANAPIVAHLSTGEIYNAAGDSPLKYKVAYQIIDTTW